MARKSYVRLAKLAIPISAVYVIFRFDSVVFQSAMVACFLVEWQDTIRLNGCSHLLLPVNLLDMLIILLCALGTFGVKVFALNRVMGWRLFSLCILRGPLRYSRFLFAVRHMPEFEDGCLAFFGICWPLVFLLHGLNPRAEGARLRQYYADANLAAAVDLEDMPEGIEYTNDLQEDHVGDEHGGLLLS
eukprot:gnl/TRDRNA2_/TRDRNA2_149550_c0_seq1.p1 gnl/TRDRNA2_/TRDRNA2_149550_c0~~gnl/TRDRNA2_/TRDRNA2_149550_c0_seq1.p1  ORF type:complete len:188 (-),score=18.74 gnl/TRDRNA2_/TRDRNA2_149550_c0_seq1:135-698(-)